MHEFIGSSLIFLADASGRTSVFMIDFGVTTPVEAPGLRHDVPWEMGNREDGYLTGLTKLSELWHQLASWDDARWDAHPILQLLYRQRF